MSMTGEAPASARIAELTAREEEEFRRRRPKSHDLVERARLHSPGGTALVIVYSLLEPIRMYYDTGRESD